MSVDVLITGAAGFVGRALLDRLRSQGRNVAGCDLRGDEHRLDVTRDADVLALLERLRPKRVVHAAALVDDRVPRAQMVAVNVGGTEAMTRAAAQVGVKRFVHVSSIAALGYAPRSPADEHSPLQPGTGGAYFDSKAISERNVRALRGAMEVVVVRPGDVFGPGSEPWVTRPVAMMRTGQPVLIGDGRGLIAHTWIDNLVDGLELALDHPGAAGQVLTITDGVHDTTYRDYFARLARAANVALPPWSLPVGLALKAARLGEVAGRFLGRPPPLTEGAIRYVTRRSTYSIEAATRLGWSPQIGLTDAMDQLRRALA